MTSATLAVGRPDLAYFRKRIGADEAEPLQLGSPFDFQKQMKLFVVQKMPDPRDAGYDEALAQWIAHFVEETEGRAFVLFTSYRGMQQAGASEMQDFFVDKENESARAGSRRAARPVARAIQNHAAQRSFRDGQFLDGRGCPGRRRFRMSSSRGCLLPCRIIRLIEAKLELVQARGGDPFTEYSLPEAILKLRQGVGRLIRTKSDSGIVVILDNRIVTKPYGRAFLSACRECPVKIL